MTDEPFDKISVNEMIYLILGVAVFQIGAADFIVEAAVIKMGYLSGIISGIFIVLGLYIIKSVLKKNYYS